jgi:hypothetical protein
VPLTALPSKKGHSVPPALNRTGQSEPALM